MQQWTIYGMASLQEDGKGMGAQNINQKNYTTKKNTQKSSLQRNTQTNTQVNLQKSMLNP